MQDLFVELAMGTTAWFARATGASSLPKLQATWNINTQAPHYSLFSANVNFDRHNPALGFTRKQHSPKAYPLTSPSIDCSFIAVSLFSTLLGIQEILCNFC